MHDALGRAGGARGKGEVDDLVGVGVGRRQRLRRRSETARRCSGHHHLGRRPAYRPAAMTAAPPPRRRCRRSSHRRRSRARRTTPPHGCATITRRSRRPGSSGAMTDCRHSPGASRRAAPRPPRPGSAATPRPARRASARRMKIGRDRIDHRQQLAPAQPPRARRAPRTPPAAAPHGRAAANRACRCRHSPSA